MNSCGRGADTVAAAETISVIIPVYNVKGDLAAAMESLRAQTFTDFRAWLVDDGSTDGSGAVCDGLVREDPRFCVIHQNNAGAHAARNTALDQCQGEYVYFMDADDLVERETLERLLQCVRNTRADIAVCGYRVEYRRTGHPTDWKVVSGFDGLMQLPGMLLDELTTELMFPPWNKLYRRSFLKQHNLRFPATYWDDTIFNIDAFGRAGRIGFINYNGYRYIKGRAGAETAKFRPDLLEKRMTELAALEQLIYEKWGIQTAAGTRLIADNHVRNLWGCLTASFMPQVNRQKRHQVIRTIVHDPSTRRYAAYITRRAHLAPGMGLLLRQPFEALVYLAAWMIAHIRMIAPHSFDRVKR